MSAQAIAEAFAPAEAHYKESVMKNTWGHLAPEKNKTYKGFIVFAVGCYGNDPFNPVILLCEFKDLDESPWFFDAMSNFIANQKAEIGNVYRFDGTFRNYLFKGKLKGVWPVKEGE